MGSDGRRLLASPPLANSFSFRKPHQGQGRSSMRNWVTLSAGGDASLPDHPAASEPFEAQRRNEWMGTTVGDEIGMKHRRDGCGLPTPRACDIDRESLH